MVPLCQLLASNLPAACPRNREQFKIPRNYRPKEASVHRRSQDFRKLPRAQIMESDGVMESRSARRKFLGW